MRMTVRFLIVFVASASCAQEAFLPGLHVESESCESPDLFHRNRVWSPDCSGYFENEAQGLEFDSAVPLRATLFSRTTRAFVIRGKATYISDPTIQTRELLAAQRTLACPFVNVEALRWIGSKHLLLKAETRGSGNCGRISGQYVVDAATGDVVRIVGASDASGTK